MCSFLLIVPVGRPAFQGDGLPCDAGTRPRRAV